MEKVKNIFIGLCIVIIAVLGTLLTLSLTGVLNIKEQNDSNILDKNEDNWEEQQEQISYNIVTETISGGFDVKKLYVNNELVDLKGSDIEVKQLNDILIVEVSYASGTLYAIDKDANIIGVFSSHNNGDIPVFALKANYWGTYRIEGNDIYVQTEIFGNGGPSGYLCTYSMNDEDIVTYEEKFTYLGNNKFSDAEVVNTVTRKQYMQEHNISCNN